MKKTILIICTFSLLVNLSCNKSTEGNKNVVQQENNPTDGLSVDTLSSVVQPAETGNINLKEYTDRYVGEDGTSALVTFKNSDTENTISIRSNNKTISAPQKEAWEKGGIYGDFDIEIIAKNDSITITQGNNIIKLKKARGQ